MKNKMILRCNNFFKTLEIYFDVMMNWHSKSALHGANKHISTGLIGGIDALVIFPATNCHP